MNYDRTSRATLRALSRVHRKPTVTKQQLRRNVAEMAAEHTPLALIRLFVSKVEVK